MTQQPISGINRMPSTANAVSINIFNPTAYGEGAQACLPTNQQQPANVAPATDKTYSYDYKPVYNVPTTSIYGQQGTPAPQAPLPPAQQPPAQAPVAQQPPAPQPAPVEPQPAPQPAPAPVAQQPAPQPAPVVAADPMSAAAAPAPAPAVDTNALLTGLKAPSLDTQAETIRKIAELGQQTNKELVKPLLNEQLFKGLTDVVNKDTSSIPADQQGKAVENRITSMWTLALLQKSLREELDGIAKTSNEKPIDFNNIPGMPEITNAIKGSRVDETNGQIVADKSTSPAIQDAAINAMMFVARPEDAPIVKPLLEIAAQQSSDANVKKSAQDGLNSLAAAPAAPVAASAPAAPAAPAAEPAKA